jgi:hypothetical protein
MNKNYKDDYIACSCGTEGLYLIKYNDEDDVYLSIWQMGYNKNNKLSWYQRLRYVWKIISTGTPYNDQIVLDNDACKKIVDFIEKQ